MTVFKDFIINIITLLLSIAISFFTITLIYLIVSKCFGLIFLWKYAVGIWFIFIALRITFGGKNE